MEESIPIFLVSRDPIGSNNDAVFVEQPLALPGSANNIWDEHFCFYLLEYFSIQIDSDKQGKT